MQRANPVEMRKSMEAVAMYRKNGIPFIAIPYSSDEQRRELIALSDSKFELMALQAEEEESNLAKGES